MTTEETSVTVADLAKINRENKPQRIAFNKISLAVKGEPEGTLGRLLWQAVRDEAMDVVRLRRSWEPLASVTDCYDASDFLALLETAADYDESAPKESLRAWERSASPRRSVITGKSRQQRRWSSLLGRRALCPP